MKQYSIYHLPQFVHPNGEIGKIGCTSYNDPQERAIEQDYTFDDFEVLEQYEDIYIASDREIELQKQYGYVVDKTPYFMSIQNRRTWTDADRQKAQQVLKQNQNQHLIKATLAASKSKMKITYEIAQQIRNEGYKPKKNQYEPGPTLKSIAAKYGYSTQLISSVIKNQTYTSPNWPN
ncbi:MAG: hypothetical protein GY928_26105 [Colwellia sp.]|nr:hypothetical protein [Colwellia sp.]